MSIPLHVRRRMESDPAYKQEVLDAMRKAERELVAISESIKPFKAAMDALLAPGPVELGPERARALLLGPGQAPTLMLPKVLEDVIPSLLVPFSRIEEHRARSEALTSELQRDALGALHIGPEGYDA